MAKVKPETTVIEDTLKAVSLPGSTTRRGLVNLIEGRDIDDGIQDTITGARGETTPQDLISSIEKNTIFSDLTAGPDNPDDRDFLDNTINFIRDVGLDIVTSPDSLIGLPAKGVKAISNLSKVGKVLDAVDKTRLGKRIAGALDGPIARKTAERSATGATLGAMSIQEDDDFVDAAGKIASGAVIGGAGSPLLKVGARTAGDIGKFGTDLAVKAANKPVFKKFHEFVEERVAKGGKDFSGGFSDFHKIVANIGKNVKPFEREYHKVKKRFDDEFIDHMRQSGLNDAQIDEKFLKFNQTIESGFEEFSSLRNIRRDQLKASGGKYNKFHIANKQATEEVDNFMAEKVLKSVERDPDMFNAVEQFYKVNIDLARTYNDEIAARAAKLDGKASKKMMMKQFHPIRLHTLDFNQLDDHGESLIRNFDTKVGARLRLSDVVEGADGKLTPKQLRDIGGQEYANLFLRDYEKVARDMMSELYKNKLKLRNTSMLDIISGKFRPESGNGWYLDAARKGLDTQDQMLSYFKSKVLASGASWSKTNYADNVIKAFIANGPMSAARVGLKTPAQGAVALGDKLTAGRISRFAGKNTMQKLLGVFDPDIGSAGLKMEDQWIDAAGEFGAIEANKFMEFRKSISDNPDLLKLVGKGSVSSKLRDEILNNRGGVRKAADWLDSKYWNSMGQVGSGAEAMARHTVFKDVAESLADEYKHFKNVIKVTDEFPNGRLRGVMNLMPKARAGAITDPVRLLEVKETVEVLKRASKIVNDTFFDYGDTTAFENLVMKRVFPFWTFTSKNIDFFLDKAFDGGTESIKDFSDLFSAKVFKGSPASRIVKSQKLFAQSGRLPTEDERNQIPGWMRQKGVRIAPNGNVIFQSPESSPVDALKALSLSNSPTGSINPLFKTPYEVLFNHDLFTGKKVRPDIDNALVDVQESTISLIGDDALEALDIFRDKKTGRLKTNNQASAVAVKVLKSLPLLPPQILDEVSRGIKKARFVDDEKDPAKIVHSVLRDIVSPVKERKFTKEEKKRQKKKTLREAKKSQAETSKEAFSRDKVKKKLKARGARGARKARPKRK